ncbi:MAG TPA: acetyl-CoA synthase subunit gamma [Phycisphaerales bacterium]|nr:acetyl-CoA synthase subunit gamma [Phycisphaerales bacterium]
MDKKYITGWLESAAGKVAKVSTELNARDKLGVIMVRSGIGRGRYSVEPGLYAVGNPDGDSPVLVSANYKLSFDVLRKELGGLDAWIMVLDTKGINVWCAAGKGTFSTDEIVGRVGLTGLEKVVNHRKIIVPQLGAPAVAAHEVRKRCGFSVIYGPVRACDITAFINAGMKATAQMRQVRFTLYDRLVLTPMELALGAKYLLLAMVVLFVLSGISISGYSIKLAVNNGIRSAVNLLAGYIGGAVIGPVLLPWLPGRSFSLKGFWVGVIVAGLFSVFKLTGDRLETAAWILLIAAVSSFITMNFTGASTYTSLSGVKKEMRIAVPLQLAAATIGIGMWMVDKFI